MKKIFLILLLVISCNSFLHAQWAKLNGPFGGGVISLAVNSSNVFAGTNDGVVVSFDNGGNWKEYDNELGNVTVNNLCVSGTNIYAGTDKGIFLTTNNGVSWTLLGLSNKRVVSILVGGNEIIAGVYSSGIYYSPDYGKSWFPNNIGLTDIYITSVAKIGRFLFTATKSANGGVYRSSDNGQSWLRVVNGLTSKYITKLAVIDSTIFAGTDGKGVFYSTNYGSDWKPMTFFGVQNVYELCAIGTTLYASTLDSGIMAYSKNNQQWVQIDSGLTNLSVGAIAGNINTLFAGTAEGISISTNNGLSWYSSNNGLIRTGIAALAFDDKNIFCATYSNGLFAYDDNSKNWQSINLPIARREFWSIAVLGNNLFTALNSIDGGVYLSTNKGKDWKSVSSGITNHYINCLFVQGINLFAGTHGGVFLSTNNGTDWTAANNGLTNMNIKDFTADGAKIFVGTDAGLFQSSNNGITWSAFSIIGNYAGNRSANVFIGKQMFVGTENGIFHSYDNGKNWNSVNDGMGRKMISTLAIRSTDMFAGTDHDGIWKRPFSELITDVKNNETLPTEFSLEQNYPNPFNPSTTINYTIPKVETRHASSLQPVTLKVYDLLGREVATLVDESKLPGNYNTQFSIPNLQLPSGVYFYALREGEFIQTKKMILMK